MNQQVYATVNVASSALVWMAAHTARLTSDYTELAPNLTRRATLIGSGPPCWLSLCYMEQRDIRRAGHTLQPLYDGAGEMSS
jgi:hypothetical protein